MPTKDELEKKVAELEAENAKLNALVDEVKAEAQIGVPRFRDADGEFAEPEEGGLYRYDGSGDLVAVDVDLVTIAGDVESFTLAGTDEIDAGIVAQLKADIQRLEIERDEARTAAQAAGQRLRDVTALHGRVDDLPGVVG